MHTLSRSLLVGSLGLLMVIPAHAGQYADQLGACLYQNMTKSDRDVFTQWAFVTIGKTKAAKQITVIPESKIKAVNAKAKESLQTLIVSKCSKEAAKVALHEPKDGLRNTVTAVAEKVMQEEFKDRLKGSLPISTIRLDNEAVQKSAEFLMNFLKK